MFPAIDGEAIDGELLRWCVNTVGFARTAEMSSTRKMRL